MTRIEAEWLAAPANRAVMAALGDAWYVGGCVRNALMGLSPGDIDLATPLRPEETTRRLQQAGLKVVPTGIDHGTVTAVCEGQGFEVTTFRADLETDGRHAVVRFSTEMAEDAARRDFTINALYADGAGAVCDPLGGLPDLAARRVRFIGDAERRIAEDYLRILRFFRFYAWYGEGTIDRAGLAACTAMVDGLTRLARERVGVEIRKLLSAPDPAPSIAAMADSGVLAAALPGADTVRLTRYLAAEYAAGTDPDWIGRLAAMRPKAAGDALRLSRLDHRALDTLLALGAMDAPVEEAAYHHGLRIARAHALTQGPHAEWDEVALRIERAAAARLPLTARDLSSAGIEPGPEMGAALGRAEEAWIASGFSLDKAALLQKAKRKGHIH
ncbi:MAG: CCA tRNA nucleotidyltransferase [Pseudomonadota bacterium]